MVVALVQSESISDQVQLCRRLAHVLNLTKQMLAHAEKGEWEQVTEIELARREDLLACFSGSMPAQDKELVAEAMATLLHLNEELMAKLKIDRDAVMAQGQEMAKNRGAVQSYREVDASV
ncbi:MAG: hypothetical protein ACI9JM_001157 [Halioglobus sp.]|jgi:hypothetical protein